MDAWRVCCLAARSMVCCTAASRRFAERQCVTKRERFPRAGNEPLSGQVWLRHGLPGTHSKSHFQTACARSRALTVRAATRSSRICFRFPLRATGLLRLLPGFPQRTQSSPLSPGIGKNPAATLPRNEVGHCGSGANAMWAIWRAS